jgi:hypothetical protein
VLVLELHHAAIVQQRFQQAKCCTSLLNSGFLKVTGIGDFVLAVDSKNYDSPSGICQKLNSLAGGDHFLLVGDRLEFEVSEDSDQHLKVKEKTMIGKPTPRMINFSF